MPQKLRWTIFGRWTCNVTRTEPLLERVWELRQNLPAYDAVYVALAEVLDVVLLTCDRRLSQAPGMRRRVVLCTSLIAIPGERQLLLERDGQLRVDGRLRDALRLGACGLQDAEAHAEDERIVV